jgi:putative ubiquitin-RnfH superfamily antitoxin RatB of RatAB toxin-antitoxin module
MSEKISIEVIYALPDFQDRLWLDVHLGATAAFVLGQSGLIEKYGLDRGQVQLGVFGRVVPASAILQDGDRLEIYRPLIADPRQKRLTKVTRKLPRRCL